MSLQKPVQLFRFPNAEFATRDTRVVHPEHGVDVFHALCADVGELLDLVCCVLDLEKQYLCLILTLMGQSAPVHR